jgi:hypothetical protein
MSKNKSVFLVLLAAILLSTLMPVALLADTPQEIAKRVLPSVVLLVMEASNGKPIATGSGGFFSMGWNICTPEMLTPPGKPAITTATLAIYKNLCAMLHEAKFCKLSDTDMENIFYNNAAELFSANN